MSRLGAIVILFMCCSLCFNAQSRKADSLRALVKNHKQDTDLVKTFIALADLLEVVSTEESTQFAKKGYELAIK